MRTAINFTLIIAGGALALCGPAQGLPLLRSQGQTHHTTPHHTA